MSLQFEDKTDVLPTYTEDEHPLSIFLKSDRISEHPSDAQQNFKKRWYSSSSLWIDWIPSRIPGRHAFVVSVDRNVPRMYKCNGSSTCRKRIVSFGWSWRDAMLRWWSQVGASEPVAGRSTTVLISIYPASIEPSKGSSEMSLFVI